MKTINGLHYTKDHEWVRVEGDKAYIGITDYAQHKLGEIVFVELPEVDTEIDAHDTVGTIESVKVASDFFSPISGKVVEVNENLEEHPELINEEPYENHIAVLELTDKDQLEGLMDEAAYKEIIKE